MTGWSSMPDAIVRFPSPPPPAFAPVELCASTQLEDRGKAYVFDVMMYGERLRAFVLRFDGGVVAYLNRCVHVPTEMDWQHGEFLDSDKSFILCSIHGAAYEPQTGRCVAGPCGKGRLTALDVSERDGLVYWQPQEPIRPAPAVSVDGPPV
jgi:nitrite reductase/ring-hydroxylating ferredoxin subunit